SSKEDPDRGVRVRINEGKLIVDLHIAVTYGVNISAIVKSIVHKVRYTVEESTGLAVAKVNVYVDSMSAQ
ncbi:MAG: Asp23/Gls24 family envelope stress response protein, partial [Angelakisella sp.]